MLTYVNMNMKRTWQNYGAKSCFKIDVEQFFENESPIPIYTFLGT
jgi:hypothetical protein